jgi:hypothetical protein
VSDNKIKARGDCLCGTIKISVDGPVTLMAQCHCRDCQRSSGTGHMPLVFLSADSVTISGEATAYASTTDSGNTSTRSFCPTCGSRVFGTNTLRPGVFAIPVGVFEDRSWFKPDVVVYSKSRDEWDISDAETPSFEMMPPA